MLRHENPDVVYRTEEEKYNAVADEIQELHAKQGSRCWWAPSPSKSRSGFRDAQEERASRTSVLNAKYHEREAEIVAQAGRKGMVTIATNMAGRGTDILLGGNAGVHGQQECVRRERAALRGPGDPCRRRDSYVCITGQRVRVASRWNETLRATRSRADRSMTK